jgi:DNA-binding NarL/FixJ family response regulator
MALSRRGKAVETLTLRQREVLIRVADGQDMHAIAAAMGISPRTVECHIAGVRQKLGIRPVALLTRFAVRAGLVDP